MRPRGTAVRSVIWAENQAVTTMNSGCHWTPVVEQSTEVFYGILTYSFCMFSLCHTPKLAKFSLWSWETNVITSWSVAWPANRFPSVACSAAQLWSHRTQPEWTGQILNQTRLKYSFSKVLNIAKLKKKSNHSFWKVFAREHDRTWPWAGTINALIPIKRRR